MKRWSEIASKPAVTRTDLFPSGTITNRRELYTLLKQALAGKAGRVIKVGKNNQIPVKLRGLTLEAWVGPKAGGGLKCNSIYVRGGRASLTRAQIQAYANAVTSGIRTLADVRREVLARLRRG